MNDTPDYERRFGGMARLYGPQALGRLQAAHVCVIGIGGVGSWAVEALARSGIGKLTLIDLDHVAESNMNRQLHAVEDNLGKAKVQAMAERIVSINPGCSVVQIDEFITPDNIAELIPACDGVIDAIDQVRPKAALAGYCRRHKQFLVTTGGAGGRVDPTRVKVDDLSRTTQDALASKLRASLRKDYGFPRDAKKKFGLPCVYSDEQITRPVLSQAEGPVLSSVEGPVLSSVEGPVLSSVEGPVLSQVEGAPDGAACAVDSVASPRAPQGLNCAGYGSSVAVTASFGFAAAAQVLNRIMGR